MAEASAPAADWTGKPCPKCGYVRTPLDSSPAWQCPRCQIAYAKFGTAAPLHKRLAAHGQQMATRASSDYSLAALIAANIIALAIALAQQMSLRDLLLVYWIQSVVIGVMSVIRILKLRRFATDGLQIAGHSVPEDEGSKTYVALFFAAHYGFFHLIYFMFIVYAPGMDMHDRLAAPIVYVACALAFLAHHAFSLRHNLASDAAGRPNLGTLMFLPYARVVPMHLMMLSGAVFGGASTGALLAFGVLKTVADAVMHTVQHHLLSQASGDPQDGESPAA